MPFLNSDGDFDDFNEEDDVEQNPSDLDDFHEDPISSDKEGNLDSQLWSALIKKTPL